MSYWGIYISCGRRTSAKRKARWADRKKQKTNADMIRSMSDEELVYFILEVGCPDGTVCSCSDNCENCWMKWLKSPSLRSELNE